MMGKTYGWTLVSVFASLQQLATIVPSYAYFQAFNNGYRFSIPGFNDSEKRTQTDAQTWCTGNPSKLLEITTDNLQTSVVWFIKNAISLKQMTGNSIITNGKRFTSTFTWLNGNAWSASLQVKGQEPGFSHSYGYLHPSQSGFEFIADMPTVQRGYICEGSSFCIDGFKTNGNCYKSNSETLSWFGARNRCIDGGGDLASFHFIVDAKGFSSLNGSEWNQPSTYWVGLQRLKWTWQDSKSDVRYSQWSDGHPEYTTNQYKECLCLHPSYDWKWSECDCIQAYQFVCITETESTSKPAPSTVSRVSVINSTRITTSATTAQPVNSPLSIRNPEYSSTTSVASQSPADYKLPVGLGVGLGGAVLIAAIILIVIVVVRNTGCCRKLGLHKSSADPPDVTPESYYATVVKNTEYDETTQDGHSNQMPPPTEYADLNIVAVSRSTEVRHERGRSLV